jgi:phage antirepressor YoqD-like protein
MSSRQIAELTGKEHRNVARDIRAMCDGLGVDALSFEHIFFDSMNRQQTEYLLDEELTLCLTSGYDVKQRMAIIRHWKQMRDAPQFKIPQTLPEALRLAADLSDQVQLQQQQLAIASPKAEALDRIATADGLLCITSAAKHLQVRPKDLFAFLQERQWIYRRAGGGGGFLGYQPRIQQGLLEHKVTVVSRSDGSEKVTEQVLVTGKGMAKLAQMLEAGAQ